MIETPEQENFFQNITTSVYIAVKVITDNYSYSNLIFNSILSYNSALTFYNQSGSATSSASNSLVIIQSTLNSIEFNYHLFINNNRIILINNISSLYSCVYAGNLNAVVNPALYANPSYLGGSLDSFNIVDGTNVTNNMFLYERSSLRIHDDTWIEVISGAPETTKGCMYPDVSYSGGVNTYGYTKNIYQDVLIFSEDGPAGYVDGVVRLFGNKFSALSEFLHNGDTYIIFPNVYRNNQNQFYAVRKN